MAEVSLTINGRNYGVACDDGQEHRVTDLAQYVDTKMRGIAHAGAAGNESHLFVLTSIVLADEIADLSQTLETYANSNSVPMATEQDVDLKEQMRADEEEVCQSIEVLAARLETIAENIDRL